MSVMTMVQAINNALDVSLQRDDTVLVYGEDVGTEGGVFRVTEGLQKKHGSDRVFDSPLAESGITGSAVGLAAAGMRPVVEMQFSGFSYPAFNQIISHVSRMRNRTRGRFSMPIVIRMPYGGGINALEHHSESMEALYAHIPGIKVLIPSTPYDAKGLLLSALNGKDPVIFMEPKKIYRAIKQEVPEDFYQIPVGKAKVVGEGSDITVVAYGAMVREALRARSEAAKQGISIEVVDLRSIYPLDRDTLGKSVRKTGRMLAVSEAPRSFSVGSELVNLAVEEAFLYLEAPPTRIGGFDTIIPYPQGEHHYRIGWERILYEAEGLVSY
jgi:pyruvate dehydrogenase E1 component beta subunit